MVKGGVECILGVHADPVFGPVVMFGLGGILVEAMRDVSFRLAPIDVAEARNMSRSELIEEMWMNQLPLLHGQGKV